MFSYKACQFPYSFAGVDEAALGTAYWSNDGAQTYSFINADIKSLPANEDGTQTEGWTITWSSHEACSSDDSKKFDMVITGTCDEGGTDSMSTLSMTSCSASASFSGNSACASAELPIT